ncbi:GNAT family N-acetyltransferase [Gulosibacter faecalis]|uniref:GNAT family N-acetyltransferase n=1 Tax=Gulosibacter faecalis TaxID=272240 RepID=A0ABW5UTR9_9MICO|nr:GNAT family N-acetyltransferase [Gulosibacter faecalis]
MDAQLHEIDDERWPALLTRVRHDIDHLPEYLAAHDEFRGGDLKLAVIEDEDGLLLVPLRLTIAPDGGVDAASPEVRAAPVFSEGTTRPWRIRAIAVFLRLLQRQRVTSLFLRFHPLLDSAQHEFAWFGAIVPHGETFNVRLDRSLDEVRAGMRKDHRRGIRKFAVAGFDYRPDPEWRYLREFHDIYTQTMERVGATDDYRLPLRVLERFRDDLHDHVWLWTLVHEGRLAMGGIVTECDGIAQALYGAVHPDFRGVIPQIGAYDREIDWALQRGARDFFIDGAAYESLRQYKQGMTTHRPVASSARIVIDPVAYGRRCADWEDAAGVPVGGVHEFFPPYRRRVSSHHVRAHELGVSGRGEMAGAHGHA